MKTCSLQGISYTDHSAASVGVLKFANCVPTGYIEDAQGYVFKHQHLSASDWKQGNCQAFQLPLKVKKHV